MRDCQSGSEGKQPALGCPWGLLGLAVANLVVTSAAVAAFPTRVRELFFPILHFNVGVALVAVLRGQALVLGMIGGLLPKRALVGLSALLAYVLINGYAMFLIDSIVDGKWEIESTAFWFGVWTITIQCAFLIARLFDGWQLSSESTGPVPMRRQYQILDLFELTAAVAAALGLYLTVRGNSATSEAIRVLCVTIGQMLFVGLPVAMTILVAPMPRRRTIAGVIGWCIVAEVSLRLISSWSFRWRFAFFPPEYALYMPIFLGMIVVNAYVVRRLGYRCWRR